ncbi:MAG: nuclear transport factor 2 family protein [Fibrobacter sp.]|nr:nuclear transport factor 2 family protein [Fibrobacter sp.]
MRSTKDVFESHILLVVDWNFDVDIEKNYSRDCVLISSYGTFYGKEGIKKAVALRESQIPEASFLYTTKSWYGEVAFLEWQADSDKTYVDDGADTFIIKNGKIVIQTRHYTVIHRDVCD